MSVTRSPAYPGVALAQAIVLAGKIHSENRTNPIDREAAAKDMGFAGMTGSSSKALADLAHYGLIEKAGKGSIRVSQRAVDILYPASPAQKSAALSDAAFAPALFGVLRSQFQDGIPSENNLRSYLMRTGFATSAIPYVLQSYRETCRLVQEAGATESHGEVDLYAPDPVQIEPVKEAPLEIASPSSLVPTNIPVAPRPYAGGADGLTLNKVNMNISADLVHISAMLDYRGLLMLEKKIASLKVLMAPEVSENDDDGIT